MVFDDIVQFHGHRCPGLAIGYRMALAAMAALGVSRAGDEELAAVVENDACGVDALQVITGCTFGKGNLSLRDYGKPVFTLYSRSSGRGVRVLFRSDAIPAELHDNREGRLQFILAAAAETILLLSAATGTVPGRARIVRTVNCGDCGEPVMETRLRNIAGRMVCIPCAGRTDGPAGQ